KLYRSVIEDVINGVKDIFLDEGVDDQALQELRQIWGKAANSTDNLHAVGEPQYDWVMKPMGDQQQHQYTVVTTGGQPVVTTTASPSTVTTVLAPPPSTTTSQVSGTSIQILLCYRTGQSSVDAELAHAGQSSVDTGLSLLSIWPKQCRHSAICAIALTLNTIALVYDVITLAKAALIQSLPSHHTDQSSISAESTLDGANDTSDEEEEEDEFQDNEEDKEDNDDDQADEDNEDEGDEEEPLNSDDDVSDEEATENFEIDNVVVCQYDKISRSRNRWKFHFKDGIMNLQGKDYVFQKAVGDAEW
ncbi:tfiia large subunit, putative, partial [Ixodes scapularis]